MPQMVSVGGKNMVSFSKYWGVVMLHVRIGISFSNVALLLIGWVSKPVVLAWLLLASAVESPDVVPE